MGKYEAILYAKKTNPVIENKIDVLKNALISVAIFSAVFVGMGFALNVIENLNYVFLSLSTTVIGSFILYLYRSEILYKKKTKIEYDHQVIIVHKVISILSILLLSNSLFFLIFLRDVFNIINLIVYAVLAIMFSIMHYANENRVLFLYHYPRMKVASSALLLFVLYVSLFSLLPIQNIALNYTISSIIISCLILIKKAFFSEAIFPKVIKPVFIVSLSISIIIFVFNSIAAHRIILGRESPLDIQLTTNVISMENSFATDESNTYLRNLIQANNQIYLIYIESIEVYTLDMAYIESLDTPEDSQSFLKYNDRLGYVTDEIMDSNFRGLYLYYEGEGFRFEQMVDGSPTDCAFFEYEGNISCAEPYSAFSTIITGVDLTDIFSYTWEYLPRTVLEDSSIFYISDELLIYESNNYLTSVKSNFLQDQSYSMNRVLVFEDLEYRVYEATNYLNTDKAPLFVVPVENVEVRKFHYDGDFYRIIAEDESGERFLYTLNSKGKLINIADIGYNSIFFTEHQVFSYNWREDYVHLLTFDAPGKYIIFNDSLIYTDLFFAFALLSIITYHLYSKKTE